MQHTGEQPDTDNLKKENAVFPFQNMSLTLVNLTATIFVKGIEGPDVSSLGKGRMADLKTHPTVQPVAIVAGIIKECSMTGDLIFDPFAGSGTVFPLVTDRVPQVMKLANDLHDHLVEVPSPPAGSHTLDPTFPDLRGKQPQAPAMSGKIRTNLLWLGNTGVGGGDEVRITRYLKYCFHDNISSKMKGVPRNIPPDVCYAVHETESRLSRLHS